MLEVHCLLAKEHLLQRQHSWKLAHQYACFDKEATKIGVAVLVTLHKQPHSIVAPNSLPFVSFGETECLILITVTVTMFYSPELIFLALPFVKPFLVLCCRIVVSQWFRFCITMTFYIPGKLILVPLPF